MKLFRNMILNIFIPVLWIIMFFIMLYEVGGLDYGLINIYLWFAIPVIMFLVNTLAEAQIKKLALLYLISTGVQIMGIVIYVFLYYHFISDEPGTNVVGQIAMLITGILNLLLSLIGIIVKSVILKFKKHKRLS